MTRASANAAVLAERFFQFSLLALVSTGYLAVAGSGYLDLPTIVLTSLGLALRALLIADVVHLEISERVLTALTIAYVGFFPLDYLFLSRGVLNATVHLVCFVGVMKVLTARSQRDYLFTATIAFLELLTAAVLSANFSFFVFLALYLLFAIAAFTSAEIRRSLEKSPAVARNGLRFFPWRLGALTAFIAAGILVLTAGLFFLLPRTADAAFRHLVSRRFYVPGFSNAVRLGEIGEIKNSSTPVMHVEFYSILVPSNLRWRGGALSQFDGRTWSNPVTLEQHRVPVEKGHVAFGASGTFDLYYRVELNAIDTDALFFAGSPRGLDIRQASIWQTDTDSFRMLRVPMSGFHYDGYSALNSSAMPTTEPTPLRLRRYLQLPNLDPRIGELARRMVAGKISELDQARAIENALRTQYSYTLELPSHEVPDPLAYFLFERRKGHCEYFASAMAVMLRTLGIPSRMASGFLGGVRNPLTGLYVVRASDAHTWVEAYLRGRGWVTFDPTPPDPNVQSLSLMTRLALYTDAAETFWQNWVVGYDMGRQGMLADRVQQSGLTWSARWLDRLAGLPLRWKDDFLQGTKRFGPLTLACAIWIALVGFFGPKLWRRWRTWQGLRRLSRGRGSVADATLLYMRMLELMRRRGYEKPAWYTPQEFSATLPPSEMGAAVAQFTAVYNALRFGGRTESAPQLSILLDKLERREV